MPAKHIIPFTMDSSYDQDFENFVNVVFPADKFDIINKTLLTFQWKLSNFHKEGFRQHCIETGRQMQKICFEKGILQETWHGYTHSYLVGVLHDIGKPFVVRNTTKTKQYFTGHAQVGARLIYLRFENEIPHTHLLVMTTLIDSHMCCLNNNPSKEDQMRINVVMNLIFPKTSLIPMLECLQEADSKSKIPPIENSVSGYLPDTSLPFYKLLQVERFQTLWKKALAEAATSATILLVDTVANYYHLDSKAFFAHHFRIGLYCVPLNLISPLWKGKSPKAPFLPTSWGGYPSVLTERKDNSWMLEVGTGLWQHIPPLVKRYLSQTWHNSVRTNPTLATLWKRYSSFDCIKAQYGYKSLQINTEYSLPDDYDVIRVSYISGTDVTYGPTRFYRGEFLLWNKTLNSVSALRSGLPVFRRNLKTQVTPDQTNVVTPKYDGSLVNILYVPKQHAHYTFLAKQFPNAVHHSYGLLFVGSKEKLIMVKELRERFDAALCMNFDKFIDGYAHYFQDEMRTFHFEMMIETDSQELTVHYPKNFCKFIGYTTLSEKERAVTLAKTTDLRAVEQNVFDDMRECENYMKEQNTRLLDGDMSCEPEGFVVYVFQNEDLVDIVKTKFLEYLVMNKPEKFPKEYQEFLSNSILMNRFQKSRDIKRVKLMLNELRQEMKEFLEIFPSPKKEFVFYMKK
ncbi:hypothetical protein AVEN_266865-1 [Araneus ventricosus]|uniref:Uncharacterized protein n=1 Tax=Araneus ventricosus TaxID=182803 RepID=A0A4Y2SVQ9_ARAVE|nr:hypothetical protein AVEN_266865-1 [Araneus ventricosus]